jgi:hypothetical protein
MYKNFMNEIALGENGELPEVTPSGRRVITEFRDDLRSPQVVFGRCNLTGEMGKCIAIDLGDISIECPDCTRGVSLEEDGTVRFSIWKPRVFQQQVTLSPEGLRKLLAWSEDKRAPIPVVTPYLAYAWQIMYKSGSRLTQFYMNPETGEEVETNTREIDWDSVAIVELVSHYPGEKVLPRYTYVVATGKFYKEDSEIDVAYDDPFITESRPFYARKVHHTFGSAMLKHSLNRSIQVQHSNILQLLGWRVGGVTEGRTPCCIIAVDDNGSWRPWNYTNEDDVEE